MLCTFLDDFLEAAGHDRLEGCHEDLEKLASELAELVALLERVAACIVV